VTVWWRIAIEIVKRSDAAVVRIAVPPIRTHDRNHER